MAAKFACRAGDTILLRAEIIGIGSEGPYVRVKTGWGSATCFWAPAAAVARVETTSREADERSEEYSETAV
jgi:hypothetical protein